VGIGDIEGDNKPAIRPFFFGASGSKKEKVKRRVRQIAKKIFRSDVLINVTLQTSQVRPMGLFR
jgi:hypothetical protein